MTRHLNFSQRTGWDRQTNPLSQRLARLKRDGRRILDLSNTNPTELGFQYAPEFFRSWPDQDVERYQPEPLGLLPARAAVSDYYRSRGSAAPPERIWLAASTGELYTQLMWLLCDPGDQILVPRPGYPLFEFFGDLAGVSRLAYDLVYEQGWHLDLDSVREQIQRASRLRALVAISPGNPTGNFLKEQEMAALEKLCADHGLALVVDEVFSDYALESDPDRVGCAVGERSCLCFVLSGLSKVAALPQLKLSWGTACGPPDRVEEAMARLEIISDSFLGVSTPVQIALRPILDQAPTRQQQIRARCQTNVIQARDLLLNTALSLLDVEGGWTGLLRLPARPHRDDQTWAETLLEKDSLWIQPGFLFDMPADSAPHLALSLLTPEECFQEGLRRIAARVQMETA